MYTHTHLRAHTFYLSLALTQTDTHTLTQPHYTPVSLSRCLVGLCSAPAREVKCRRAGPDCTVGGEGDGWLGVVVLVEVEVWGAREGGLDEKQLPQDGGVWMEGRGGGGQPPLCNSAVLKARAVLEAWGCWGK